MQWIVYDPTSPETNFPTFEQFQTDPKLYVVLKNGGAICTAYPSYDDNKNFEFWNATARLGESNLIPGETVYAFMPLEIPNNIIQTILGRKIAKKSYFAEVYR